MKSVAFLAIALALFGLVAQGADQAQLSMQQAAKFLVYAPRPDYPPQARQKKLTGRAVLLVRVDSKGSVASATIAHSTGSAILDQAAIATMQRWRFRPGHTFSYEQPISYTSRGASY